MISLNHLDKYQRQDNLKILSPDHVV